MDETEWMLHWIAWDSLNRRCERAADPSPDQDLDPFDSIDLPTALSLAEDSAAVAAGAAASFRQSRRLRLGAFGRAVSCALALAGSARALASAAAVAAAGQTHGHDLDGLGSEDLRSLGARACCLAIIGACGARIAEINIGSISVSIEEALGTDISMTARGWLWDLNNLAGVLSLSSSDAGQLAHRMADHLAVTDLVAASAEEWTRLAQIAEDAAVADDEGSLAEAAQSTMTQAIRRTQELSALLGSPGGADFFAITAMGLLADCTESWRSAMRLVDDLAAESQCGAHIDCMVANCAIASAMAHCGAFTAQVLASQQTGPPASPAQDYLIERAVVSCAIAASFLTSPVRLVAGSFEDWTTVEIVDRYEQRWLDRYAVARLLRVLG